jgi:hypothetical protein
VLLIVFGLPASIEVKVALSCVIVLGVSALNVLIVARMSSLAAAEPSGAAGVMARITQLAGQIQAGDVNVARLAARLEHVDARPQLASALDVVAARLSELEAAIDTAQGSRVGGDTIVDALNRVSARLNDLENANYGAEMASINARLGILDDQLTAAAANVERLVRSSPKQT